MTLAIAVDYQDPYVEPMILYALKKVLSEDAISFLRPSEPLPVNCPTLQWRTYETIDFAHSLTSHVDSCPQIMNSYVIRKALIRKHYLAHTILSHVTKHPSSPLKSAFPTTVDFELDYAEFLDEALVEAFELRESFEQNEGKEPSEKEWWILKPSMSDRGQGIRMFSSEEELTNIFEAWEAEQPDSDEEEIVSDEAHEATKERIVTSHLRHFIAQKYITSPLLIPQAPFSNRKFHIRTYVVAVGALRVYVYDRMLALFASEAYVPPWHASNATGQQNSTDTADGEDPQLLQRMRNVHLTNTCVQNAGVNAKSKTDNVYLLSQLPLPSEKQSSIVLQINALTAEMFSAALAHPTNFQALPMSFEIFGIDFLVTSGIRTGADADFQVHVLEVNAFPDFAQTGVDLGNIVIQNFFDEIVGSILAKDLGLEHYVRAGDAYEDKEEKHLVKVHDIDLGRR